MLNVLYAELLKLKRSKIIWLVIIGALLPALIATFGDFLNMQWRDLLINNMLFLNVMVGPLILSLLAGFIVVREYSDNTVNQLFVYPHRRITILMGKTLVILLLTVAIFALNYGAILLSGSLLSNQPLPDDMLGRYTEAYLWLIVLQALLIPITMTAGIVGKSFIPPIVLGIVAILINMIAISGVEDNIHSRVTLVSYIPFGSIIVHMLDIVKMNVDRDIVRIHALYPQVAVFVLFLLFNMLYYTKSEVHSGS